MMFYSEHARERAFERYNIVLGVHNMREILRACQDGRAWRMQTTDQGDVYVWRYFARTILPVIRNGEFIVTFLPGDYFSAGSRLRRKQTKQVPHTPEIARNEPYQRPKAKREAIKQVRETAS